MRDFLCILTWASGPQNIIYAFNIYKYSCLNQFLEECEHKIILNILIFTFDRVAQIPSDFYSNTLLRSQLN